MKMSMRPQVLTELNSYRIRSRCEKFIAPRDLLSLRAAYKNSDGSSVIILGGGNNVIFSRTYYPDDFIFISTRRLYATLLTKSCVDSVVVAGAGVSLRRLCYFSVKNSLGGLEKLWGIPSTVGGAVVMNAGAFGTEIHQFIDYVIVYDSISDAIISLPGSSLGTEYRSSIFRQRPHYVILKIAFKLDPVDSTAALNDMREIGIMRARRFPYELPNAGSVFKKPLVGVGAGKLIENLGLKGWGIGDAMVSTKHAGFIVNVGNATGTEIKQIAESIRSKILQHYGISLEMEQIIL
ncbi:UDP-N-acetylmuramate dehydrogenase [Aeromonas enteropelogenes]|uniref:UDP-N-acetylmuramate dehydrogenase n=1 Tax=Aeromonas enteropelogenes TaxID=29489 RepID=UPI003F745157